MSRENRDYSRYLLLFIDSTFILRLVILACALFIMTLGVALCIRTNLGSSPISVLPLTWSLAGGTIVGNFKVPEYTVGEYTILMNILFIALQIVILRRQYRTIQLLQIIVGFIFGLFLDFNMRITEFLQWDNITISIIQLLIGGFIMALGISLEVMTRLVMMPGEGITLAFAKVTKADFGKVKIGVDCSIVAIGLTFIYIYFGSWQWNIVGIGTLITMVYCGTVVRLIHPFIIKIEQKVFKKQ